MAPAYEPLVKKNLWADGTLALMAEVHVFVGHVSFKIRGF